MEVIPGLDASISMDYNSDPAPYGAVDFYKKYGYFILKDLYDFKHDYNEFFDYLTDALKEHLKFDVEKINYSDILFLNNNLDMPSEKSELTAIYQHYTNRSEIPTYIRTENGEDHVTYLSQGYILVHNNNTDVHYHKLSEDEKLMKKSDPIEYYFHQIFFNYKFI